MKKTKIICTMGPNADNRDTLKQLALHGMDVARFNFSHGDHEEQKGRLELLKSVREELDLPIAALLDTKGPEIRTGLLKDGKVHLQDGMPYTLTTREVEADGEICHVNYAGLPACVKPGTHILIDDGLIDLAVERVENTEIFCRVVSGGELGQKKGVNVPKTRIDLPGLTEKDKADIRFGMEQGFDFIAASFVRNADVIREIRKLYETDIPIFAICLGHQLMALAIGAKTHKMRFGHRGVNHPVKDLDADRTYITSQNHGYAVVGDSVDPKIARVRYVNLNDGTVEGVEHIGKPIFTVQYHPEVCPGPMDTSYLFDKFIENIEKSKGGAQ